MLRSAGGLAKRYYATASSKSSYGFLSNGPATQITALPNGLRVASQKTHAKNASIGVFIDTGSVYETPDNNGTAHFLEHLAFKGTSKRTQKQIEEEVENMGAHLNAYTSREHTVFSAQTFGKDIPFAVDLIADIITNSTLSQDNIERERNVILREMEEVNKNQDEVVFDHLHAVAFQGSSLAHTILGPVKNIRSITRENLHNYIKTHYTPDRMVVVGAGDVDHGSLVDLSQKYFGNLPKGFLSHDQPGEHGATPFVGSMVTIEDADVSPTHIAIATEGSSWRSDDFYTFLVIQTIIGQWDKTQGSGDNVSSHLCEILAKEHLVDSVMSFNTCYRNTGLFGVKFATSPEKVEDACYAMLNEWVRLSHEVGDGELQRSKEKLKSSLVMHLDGSNNIMEDIGRQILTVGRRITPAEAWRRIDAVDASTIKRVAKEYLTDVDPAVAAVGRLYNLPDYNQLRGWTYWNRL